MMNNYRIAIIAPCPFPSNRGTPVRIYETAVKLGKLGHDVHVFTYHLGDENIETNFHIHRVNNIDKYKNYSPGPTFRKLFQLDVLLAILIFKHFRENRFDVIHGHNYEGLIIGLIIKRIFKTPLVYDAHNTLESELPYYYKSIPKFIKRWTGVGLDKILCRKADRIVAVTSDIKSKLIQRHGINECVIKVISNGADIEHFQSNGLSYKRNKTGIKRYILYAGNTAAYQRIDLLLEIFKLIRNKNKNVYLNIATNSGFDDYYSIAESMGVFENIILHNTDYSLLPGIFSISEVAMSTRIDCDGIPLKLLNYMSAGLPVVSFEGSAKIIRHNETGLVVKNSDTITFADSVLALLNNDKLAAEIGKNGYEYVKTNHSWQNTAEDICKVYGELTG